MKPMQERRPRHRPDGRRYMPTPPRPLAQQARPVASPEPHPVAVTIHIHHGPGGGLTPKGPEIP
jgi:hypothetical protein